VAVLRRAIGGCALALGLGAAGCGGASQPPAAAPKPLSAGQRLNLGVTAIDAVVGGDRVRSSGIILDGGRGLVLTSAHSLWGATSLRLTTGVGTVYGRIVARAPCDDLALVETQPRIPGLASIRPAPAATPPRGDLLRAVGRRGTQPEAGSFGLISIPIARAGAVRARKPAKGVAFPHPSGAIRLDGPLVPAASGGPILDRASRVVGMAIAPAAGAAFAVPWRRIELRLAELRPGPRQVYVGWRSQYHCVAAQHRYAKATHPGFKPINARLNAPVPATRLPGTAKAMGDG
jgi:S1-C subfamily serine protease